LKILDGATSVLKAEAEWIISKTLGSLLGDVALVVIAHRLATSGIAIKKFISPEYG
jgi:ABC-type transport system involved in Fe-S cluster assembly fused permease/ATPase subunit